MNMKKSKMTRKKKNISDAVIKNGQEIYEKWNSEKLTSRKIVEFVESTIDSVRTDRNRAASCLFALYMRIKKRYASPLSRIIFYFSLRKEMYALKRLEKALDVTENAGGVAAAMEVDLKELVERVRIENIIDDVDDTVHGGKRVEKSEESEIEMDLELDSANKKSEELTNDNQEEHLEIEEKGESADEKTQDSSNNTSNEETTSNVATDDQHADNATPSDAVAENNAVLELNSNNETAQEHQNDAVEVLETREEINAPSEMSEQVIDALGQPQAQNTEVAEGMQVVGDIQQATYIFTNNTVTTDEMVLEGISELMQIAAEQDVFGLNNGQTPGNQISQDALDEQEYVDYLRFQQWKENSRSEVSGGDSHGEEYDSSSLIIPSSEVQNPLPNHLFENVPDRISDPEPEPVPEPVKQPEPKPVQQPVQQPVPQSNSNPVVKQPENKDVRQPIQVNLMEDPDFDSVVRINTNISSESVAQFYEYKAAQFKEYIDQLAAEFKFQAPEILGRPNLEEVYRQAGIVPGV